MKTGEIEVWVWWEFEFWGGIGFVLLGSLADKNIGRISGERRYNRNAASVLRPTAALSAGRTSLMDLHATDALVTGYEDLIPGLQLPDPDDRHVLAAAIRGQADVIVTMNLRDFAADVVGAFGIEAQHPDEFVLHLLDLAPGAVIAATETHRQSLKNPAKTMAAYLEALERQGLTQTASALGRYGKEYFPHVP